MGDIGFDGPSILLTWLIYIVFKVVFLLDWVWGVYLYALRGLVMAAHGSRRDWATSLCGLLHEPVIGGRFAGRFARRWAGATSQFISITGALAGSSGDTEIRSRVARVWPALPDGVGIVAVDGVLLKASSVRALAAKAKFEEYVVIVGPSSVVTSYQIGLVAQQAFSVVEDLTPESATVHPLIPQSWGDKSFLRLFLRAFTSLVALATAVWACMSGSTGNIEIGGFDVVAIAALLCNFLSRIILRPERANIASDDSPHIVPSADIAAAEAAEAPVAEISIRADGEGTGNSNPGDEQNIWDRFKRESVELMPHVLASASYGLSGLSGITAWMSWALLAVGAASNAVFSTSGATYVPLTGWVSGLIAPLFVITWVVYFALAVALSPITSIGGLGVMCYFAGGFFGDKALFFFGMAILLAWATLATILSISVLAGAHLTPDWVLYLSWVGLVPVVVCNISLELMMLGWMRLDKAVSQVKGWAMCSEQMLRGGFGHISATGLHVRFIPSYVAGTPGPVSVVVGMRRPDHRCWYWKG